MQERAASDPKFLDEIVKFEANQPKRLFNVQRIFWWIPGYLKYFETWVIELIVITTQDLLSFEDESP